MSTLATAIEGENVMTDFQFKAILAMVLEMLEKCKTIDDVTETKKTIARWLSGELAPIGGSSNKSAEK